MRPRVSHRNPTDIERLVLKMIGTFEIFHTTVDSIMHPRAGRSNPFAGRFPAVSIIQGWCGCRGPPCWRPQRHNCLIWVVSTSIVLGRRTVGQLRTACRVGINDRIHPITGGPCRLFFDALHSHGQVTIEKSYAYMGELHPQPDLSNTNGTIEAVFTAPALVE